jgi:hypothetical protein
VGGAGVVEGSAAVVDTSSESTDSELVLVSPVGAKVVPVPASHLAEGASPSEEAAAKV